MVEVVEVHGKCLGISEHTRRADGAQEKRQTTSADEINVPTRIPRQPDPTSIEPSGGRRPRREDGSRRNAEACAASLSYLWRRPKHGGGLTSKMPVLSVALPNE